MKELLFIIMCILIIANIIAAITLKNIQAVCGWSVALFWVIVCNSK